ncbi:hypothetical protein CQA40_06135 [Helicobacter sp. MIT 01-3238]|nr:hypothetical protein CQA40_06135 [Helicobacter sp. MIT 01-3238]
MKIHLIKHAEKPRKQAKNHFYKNLLKKKSFCKICFIKPTLQNLQTIKISKNFSHFLNFLLIFIYRYFLRFCVFCLPISFGCFFWGILRALFQFGVFFFFWYGYTLADTKNNHQNNKRRIK